MNKNNLINSNMKGSLNMNADGKIELTPEVAAALGITSDNFAGDSFNSDSQTAFAETKLSKVYRRPISTEEYASLPSFEKKGIHQLLNMGYLFTVIVLAIFTFFVITNPGLDAYASYWKYLIIAVAVIIIAVVTFFTINRGLSKNSEIAVGSVVFCSAGKHSGGSFHYFVSVSFPETKQYVQKIECRKKTFNNLRFGSKVYVDKSHAYSTGLTL